MNYIEFQKAVPRIGGTGGNRGDRVWWETTDTRTGEHGAMVVCPKCGAVTFVPGNRIEESGTVRPVFRCYNPGGKCAFRGWIRLSGWDAGARR